MTFNLTTLIDKILERRVLTHVLYWIGVVMIWAIPRSFEGGYEPLVNKLCYLPPQLFVTYLLLYHQIPMLLFQRKYLKFMGAILISIYLATVIARILKVYVYETVLDANLPKDSLYDIFTEPQPLLGQYLLWIIITPLVTLLIKFLKDHFQTKQRMDQLKKEKTTAELNFLKAQIHPHFLFNTLNNLYTLTLSKSDRAPDIVKKLSDILAYMFYQGDKKMVQISEEIQLLQNYIDLEMLRYGNRLELIFEKDIDHPDVKISPLVLLSMVENAFKHGASGDIGTPKIHIYLKVMKERLSFQVFNTKPQTPQKDEHKYKKGIGVSNIKRQLELLYPNKYQLTIDEKANTYEVSLNIDLQRALAWAE